MDLIDRNWADILRVAATMAAGTIRPSQLLRKLAAYPRQNELAAALREVGRIERSLFMIEWTTDPDVRRRALVGLNKGEAHHALKRAINFHQRGELRDRTGEGQHYRVAGLNLLAAIIIYWNTLKLGDAVFARQKAGLESVFAQLRKEAGLQSPQGARWQPRLHDLRHTFAVNRLIAWYREGADVQSCLPFLSTYLGHANISGTQAYLTMTPELLTEASKRFARYAVAKEGDNDND